MIIRIHFLMILVVLCAVLCPSAQAKKGPTPSLSHADRLLAVASLPPTDPEWSGLPRLTLRQSLEAFQSVLDRRGPDPRVYLGMAEAWMEEGNYEAAMRFAEDARLLLNDPAPAERILKEAAPLLQLAKTASRYLPSGHKVLCVMNFPAPSRRNLWVTLSSNRRTIGPRSPEYTNAVLTLFRGGPESLTRVWQSDQLGYPGYTNGRYNDIQLYLVDLNHDGIPEAIVPQSAEARDWTPSRVDVFTWRAGRLVSILGTNSEFPIRIEDLNHDRIWEIIVFHTVGWNVPIAEQVQWEDIYAYGRGSYALANEEFPDSYRENVAQLRSLLKTYPDDFEVHQFLGMAYEILGKKSAALAEYRSGLSNGRNALYREANPQRIAHLQRALDDIRERISALTD